LVVQPLALSLYHLCYPGSEEAALCLTGWIIPTLMWEWWQKNIYCPHSKWNFTHLLPCWRNWTEK